MSGIRLVQEFFGAVRSVILDEMKVLSTAERKELADLVAIQRGMVAITADGKTDYVEKAA